MDIGHADILASLRTAYDRGADDREMSGGSNTPWKGAAFPEIEHHSDTKDLVESLRSSGRFAVEGQERTGPVPFEQSVNEYIEFLHSTSSLARVRLGDRSERFDAQIRAVFAKRGLDRVRYAIVGLVAWGRPT